MKAVLVISARDNVATALEPLDAGRRAGHRRHAKSSCATRVSAGHKIAIAPIAPARAVMKYGSAIGIATADIAPGAHVHTHNVASTRGRGDLGPRRPSDAPGGSPSRPTSGRRREPTLEEIAAARRIS